MINNNKTNKSNQTKKVEEMEEKNELRKVNYVFDPKDWHYVDQGWTEEVSVCTGFYHGIGRKSHYIEETDLLLVDDLAIVEDAKTGRVHQLDVECIRFVTPLK